MDQVTASLIGTCIATIIPLLFVCFIIKEKGSKYILLYFCWGTLAGLLAFGFNNLLTGTQGQTERVTTAIAPVVEEFCKGLPILLFLIKKKKSIITVLIVYCAFASGIGFSIQESIYYFSQTGGTAGDIATLAVRTMTTALMHGISTAVIGLGLMQLQKQGHILLPVIAGLFALGTGIHALFNLLLPTNLAVIAALMPVGLYFAGMVFLNKAKGDEYEA